MGSRMDAAAGWMVHGGGRAQQQQQKQQREQQQQKLKQQHEGFLPRHHSAGILSRPCLRSDPQPMRGGATVSLFSSIKTRTRSSLKSAV